MEMEGQGVHIAPPIQNKRRAARTSQAQYEMLVQYMTSHSAFAAGKFLGKEGKVAYEERWATLCSTLNGFQGGAQKNVKQWQTVWRDLKFSVSTKIAKRRRELNATGNREVEIPPLTPLELKVAAVVGSEYMEGTDVPDSIPEQGPLQRQLEQGDEAPLHLPAETIIVSEEAIQGEVIIEHIEEFSILGNTTPTTVNAATANEETETPLRAQKRRRSDQKTPKKPSRQRIGVQLQEARTNFSALFQQQNECLKMIGEAAKLQAEAAKLQAEASMKQAEAALKQADNEKRRLQIFSEMMAALPRGSERSDVLRQCAEVELLLSPK